VVSGGVPVGSPMDHATPYLTQVLSFIGITDVTIIDGTTVGKKESALQQIKELQLE
jgi:FMN-dependent NADH-azoreductase